MKIAQVVGLSRNRISEIIGNMKAIACLLAFVLLSGCAAVYKSPGDILRKQHTEPKLLKACVVLADGETLYAVNTLERRYNE